MKKTKTKKQQLELKKPVERTTTGLRNALFDELDGLRANKVNPERANSVSKTAAQILATARLEMDHQRFITHMKGKGQKIETTTPLYLGK